MLRFQGMLNFREQLIMKFLEKGDLSIGEILEKLKDKNIEVSKMTLNRDLQNFEEQGLINREGAGKATKYKLSSKYKILRDINFAEYFSVDADDRTVSENFDWDIHTALLGILDNEKKLLDELNDQYRLNVKSSSATVLRKELERLLIELSWKSSKLEGNTYNLLDTERLIKERIETKGHSHEEAVMILNHKKALDYIIENKKDFKKIDIQKIQKIHSLLVDDLDITKGFRNTKVGIIGTKYKPLQNKADIQRAMENLCETINKEKYPLAKALISIAMLSYIQAFQDGNKRTARILSTAILMAYDYCPLSYRNVDEYDYKKSILLFYEQNNIVYLKQLFVDQFKFAVAEYF